MLMCKATRGDHYSYKDSLKLSDYKVQDVSAANSGPAAGSQTGTLGTHARRLTQRVSSDSRDDNRQYFNLISLVGVISLLNILILS